MRDPKRIDVILQEISNIWHKYPDMRLGQLIGNVLEGPSLYYVEDNGLVDALKDTYEGAEIPVKYDNEAYIWDLVKKHPGELGFVLSYDTYEEYLKTYETVPDEEPELTENEYTALRNFFTSLEEKPKEEGK